VRPRPSPITDFLWTLGENEPFGENENQTFDRYYIMEGCVKILNELGQCP